MQEETEDSEIYPQSVRESWCPTLLCVPVHPREASVHEQLSFMPGEGQIGFTKLLPPSRITRINKLIQGSPLHTED